MFGWRIKVGDELTTLKAKQYSGEVHFDELRTDVARLTLLTRALADLCLESGVLTKASLKKRIEQLDASKSSPKRGLDLSKALDELLSEE